MYVLANGALTEDKVIDHFNQGWKLYELCEKNDDRFVETLVTMGTNEDTARQLVVAMKDLKHII